MWPSTEQLKVLLEIINSKGFALAAMSVMVGGVLYVSMMITPAKMDTMTEKLDTIIFYMEKMNTQRVALRMEETINVE